MPSIEEQLARISKQIAEQVKMKVSIPELFSDDFMQENSKYLNIHEFQRDGNFVMDTEEDIEKIDEEQLDSFIRKNTKFDSWKEMYTSAATIQVQKKLIEQGYKLA
jgi:hypothetical protein